MGKECKKEIKKVWQLRVGNKNKITMRETENGFKESRSVYNLRTWKLINFYRRVLQLRGKLSLSNPDSLCMSDEL